MDFWDGGSWLVGDPPGSRRIELNGEELLRRAGAVMPTAGPEALPVARLGSGREQDPVVARLRHEVMDLEIGNAREHGCGLPALPILPG